MPMPGQFVQQSAQDAHVQHRVVCRSGTAQHGRSAVSPTFDSCSFHHLHSTMNTDTAAPTANWIMTTLRLFVASSVEPAAQEQQRHQQQTKIKSGHYFSLAGQCCCSTTVLLACGTFACTQRPGPTPTWWLSNHCRPARQLLQPLFLSHMLVLAAQSCFHH